jgi:hypothetical protein
VADNSERRGAAVFCGERRRLPQRPGHGPARAVLRDVTGQVLVFVVIVMVVLIALTGFAVDVGRAYFTQRALQASADAAALAGAQELPDPGASISTAHGYSGQDGAKNKTKGVDGVSANVYTRCLESAPGCEPVNAVVVEQSASVQTFFARVVGIDSFDVDVRATACSPCAAKPLDIMLVLDRTGSMCQTSSGAADPSCADLNNARDGMRTFLGFMDPSIDWVGLGVFPPGTTCGTPSTSAYNSTSSPYVLVPLADDYWENGDLDPDSQLVSTIDCQQGGGRTSYSDALAKAQAELDASGRPDVQDVIILLSDGAANIGPTYYPPTSPHRMQPCHQGVDTAAGIKARGTLLFTIGYDLNAEGGDANRCTDWQSRDEQPSITAYSALQQMASPDAFFNKPAPGQLKSIFTKIAADISRPAARLIDDDIE